MSSRPQNQPCSLLRSFRLLLVMVVNKDEAPDLIRTDNAQLMAGFFKRAPPSVLCLQSD